LHSTVKSSGEILKAYHRQSRLGLIICLFLISLQVYAGRPGKLDPRLNYLVHHPDHLNPAQHATVGRLEKGLFSDFVDVVVTLKGETFSSGSHRFQRLTRQDNMVILRIPVTGLAALSNHPDILYVESSVPLRPFLDKSLPAIHYPELQQHYSVGGKGVLVGIIDTGIDWRHQSFRKADGSTRILYLLDLSIPGAVLGGRIYTESDINSALQQQTRLESVDINGHGTHVTGIAAGGGDENGRYAGVAPSADLVVVKATRDQESKVFQSIDQILALSFIDSIAGVLQRPYVANLSFGGHFGAHDGTFSIERFIDKITGPGIPGKAVVTVAGNNGNESIHSFIDFDQEGSSTEVRFNIQGYSPNPGTNDDIVQLDAWYPGSESVEVTLISPAGRSFGPVRPGEFTENSSEDGFVYIWNSFYEKNQQYIRGCNPFNGDCEIYVEISDADNGAVPRHGDWTMFLKGSGGSIDIYLANSSMSVELKNYVQDQGLLAIPGTAKNVITVGSYVTKMSWIDLDDHRLTINPFDRLEPGDLSPFSSAGPTRDGRIKPEVCAPGQVIASARSRDALTENENSIYYSTFRLYPNAYILQDSSWGISSGTSMAAPHVAGVSALLFEKDAELSSYQIARLLKESATLDAFVSVQPNFNWGWGKLNAYNAFNEEPADDPVVERLLVQNYPNPFFQLTCIQLNIPVEDGGSLASLKIYNQLGQFVRTLTKETLPANEYAFYWDGTDEYGFKVASGIYFLEVRIDSRRYLKKLAFLGQKF
jgi:subtilisin family serine protease